MCVAVRHCPVTRSLYVFCRTVSYYQTRQSVNSSESLLFLTPPTPNPPSQQHVLFICIIKICTKIYVSNTFGTEQCSNINRLAYPPPLFGTVRTPTPLHIQKIEYESQIDILKKFFIISQTRWVEWQYILNQRRVSLCGPKQN